MDGPSSVTWTFGRQSPDNCLMRFVDRRLFAPASAFLDIGSGEGANARELEERKYRVITIDKDPSTSARYLEDIREFEWDGAGDFDLIYDINTLCHIKDPPFEKIRGWLKPEGVFFSICPTAIGPQYIHWGKDYTRRVDEVELRLMLDPFFKEVRIYWRGEPDFKGNQLESWIVEARP